MAVRNKDIEWFAFNVRRSKMKGKKGALADAMGVRAGAVSEILSGQRDLSFSEGVRAQAFFAHVLEPPSTAKVVGRIGAGQEIEPEYEQVPPEGFYEVDIPLLDSNTLGKQAIAFEVVGESMYPRYEPGDLIVCLDANRDPVDLLGRDVAVRTGNGKRYLKKIRAGSRPGLYDLESHNATTIRDAEIAWISEVIHASPEGRYKPRPNDDNGDP